MNHTVGRGFLAACCGLVLVFCGILHSGLKAKAGGHAPTETFRIVHTYPHDSDAFTQGLLFGGGFLYESTGLEGHSSVRKVQLETGRVLQKLDVPPPYFAEGLADWRNHLVQLTWVSHTGFVYDLDSFRKQTEFTYGGEGWGLTHDEHNLIMSDGSDTLRYLDPQTYRTVRKIRVHDGGESIINLNELEYIRGEIYANVWQTDRIARISPRTGDVTAWIDLSGLLNAADRSANTDVLNGIAYDAATDRLFVTGKRWPKLFEIRVVN